MSLGGEEGPSHHCQGTWGEKVKECYKYHIVSQTLTHKSVLPRICRYCKELGFIGGSSVLGHGNPPKIRYDKWVSFKHDPYISEGKKNKHLWTYSSSIFGKREKNGHESTWRKGCCIWQVTLLGRCECVTHAG